MRSPTSMRLTSVKLPRPSCRLCYSNESLTIRQLSWLLLPTSQQDRLELHLSLPILTGLVGPWIKRAKPPSICTYVKDHPIGAGSFYLFLTRWRCYSRLWKASKFQIMKWKVVYLAFFPKAVLYVLLPVEIRLKAPLRTESRLGSPSRQFMG